MQRPFLRLTLLLFTLIHVEVIQISASPVQERGCPGDPDLALRLETAKEVDVVVIGGGVAGLAALSTLLQHNVTNVLLLEAQDRLGGRVRTYREGEVVVEDGAEWIHGDERNVLHRLASSLGQLDQPLPEVLWDWRLLTEDSQPGNLKDYGVLMSLLDEVDENGVLEPFYDTGYGAYFINRFSQVFPDSTPHRDALLHYLHQTVNSEEGTGSWMDISAYDADQFVDLGEDFQWSNGYDTLITHLKEKVPASTIRLSCPVNRVVWDCPPLLPRALVVTQDNQTFLARHVLTTVSSGYLKTHHSALFDPLLPNDFLHNLEGVTLGVANKVQIGWAEPWWGLRPLALSILWTRFNLPPAMSWLYSAVDVFSVHRQRAVLELFVTGNDSRHMENLEEEEVKNHVIYMLKEVMGHEIPPPTFFRRSRWSQDPWTLGSYSTFITVEGNRDGLRSHSQLAKPVKNSAGHTVLLWAGEHTHNTRYGTVDGALETGYQEALKIVRLLSPSQ